MTKPVYAFYPSPCGMLALFAGEKGLQRVLIDVATDHVAARFGVAGRLAEPLSHPLIAEVVAALNRYFQGQLQTFDLPLELHGLSPFSTTILHALQQVPFGTTCTYGSLAVAAGHRGAARAVGRVMAINPLPLVIPCHRVISVSGLGGYSGGRGLQTKQLLLDFERSILGRDDG